MTRTRTRIKMVTVMAALLELPGVPVVLAGR
jgi:hypothetical protein